MEEKQRKDLENWKYKTAQKRKADFYPVLPKGGKSRAERRAEQYNTPGAKLLLRRKGCTSSLRRLERFYRIKNNERSATHLQDLNENASLDAELAGKETYRHLHPTRGYKVKPCQ